MKKLLSVVAIVLMTLSGHAQKTIDIGIWGGSSTVWGDMDDNTPFQKFNLNYGAFFRYNFNPRVGLRIMFLNGKMAGEGTVEYADWVFDKNGQDLTVQAEVNYLNFLLGRRKMRFTPYVTVGIGIANFRYFYQPAMIYTFNPRYPEIVLTPASGTGDPAVYDREESVITSTFPFGMGAKYAVTDRLGVGIEYQMRKYWSDKLDDLDDPLSYVNTVGETITYTTDTHNNDWVGYLGVHVTYKFYVGKKACPAYGAKN